MRIFYEWKDSESDELFLFSHGELNMYSSYERFYFSQKKKKKTMYNIKLSTLNMG